MMRALWSAASGMISQQINVDTISNNIANVNTTGYKSATAEFKSLLYQNLQAKTTSANGEEKPVGAQVGLGVRNSAITSHFTQGSMFASNSNTAFAITGDGFFAVRGEDGNTYYTRSGDFKYALASNGGIMLATSEGLPVLDNRGRPIVLDKKYQTSKITISKDGEFCYPDAKNNPQPIGIKMGVFQFSNPAGLQKESNTLLSETLASGQAINESTNRDVKPSQVIQGYLEGSNVQVVDEMVNLIVAQRAYEMNSKAIQSADTMLQQANELKR